MELHDRIEIKLDTISSKLEVLNVIVAKQEVHLAEHIRRTAIAEQNIEAINKKLDPIEAHIDNVEGASKLTVLVGIIVGIIAAIYGIYKG